MKSILSSTFLGKRLLIPENLTHNNFDLIRFLLATAVVFSHCYVLYYGKVIDREPIMIFTKNQVDLGGIAVDFFFVISGFLIVRSFEYSSSFADYLVKRILRIIPGLLVAVLVSTFFFGVLGTADATHIFGNWNAFVDSLMLKWSLVHLIHLEAPSPAHTFATNPIPDNLNGPLWSIKYEFICYLLIPLVGLVGKIKRPLISIFIFLLCYTVLVLQTLKLITINDPYSNWIYLWPSILSRLFSFFFAGTVLYYYRHKVLRHPLLAVLATILILLTAVIGQGINMILPIAGTYLAFYLAYHPRISFHNFAKKGDFSYGMYLYGWPVQQLTLYFFQSYLSPISLFFVSVVFTFVVAYFSWHLVESQALKLKKKIWWFTPSKKQSKEHSYVQMET